MLERFAGRRSKEENILVRTILPNVELIEEIFDFGQVTTLGNPGILRFSIQNLSNLKANLIIDLRKARKRRRNIISTGWSWS